MTIKNTQKTKVGEILYGAHPIIEMLKANRRKLIALYTTKPTPKAWDRMAEFMPKYVPNIQYVTRAILDRMAGTPDHNGVIAWVSPFKYAEKVFDPAKKPLIVVLDAVQDVRNVGAILRSANCIGVSGVVLCKSQGAPMNAAVFKASAGLAEHVEIYLAPTIKSAALELKAAGYNLYMAVLDGGTNAMTTEFKGPACLIIGNEASGISPEIKKLGTLITLPQRAPDISFNASVAAGILMFVMNEKLKA
jgi:23S rRNA (guanosine2251-2'-O)-methyltransferase